MGPEKPGAMARIMRKTDDSYCLAVKMGRCFFVKGSVSLPTLGRSNKANIYYIIYIYIIYINTTICIYFLYLHLYIYILFIYINLYGNFQRFANII